MSKTSTSPQKWLYVRTDDWAGLYDETDLLAQDHVIGPEDSAACMVLETVLGMDVREFLRKEHGIILECREEHAADDEIVYRLGMFPDSRQEYDAAYEAEKKK